MPRYKLTIAYEGSDFCGWQKQEPLAPWALDHPVGGHHHDAPAPPADTRDVGLGRKSLELLPDRPGRVALRTVQHVLERAVREVVREPVELLGSSRTDSGVHAVGQVAAFSCSGDLPEGESPDPDHKPRVGWPLARGADRLLAAINGRLPEDCLVTAVEPVPQSFHPIADTIAKGYSYTIHTSRTRPLFDRRRVHHVWETLDIPAMLDAAPCFEGEHDFAAFAAAGHGRLSTVRTVHACRFVQPAPDRLRLDISGNGFLWNMVRIIAGTLADVGRGHLKPSDIPTIIASKDRAKAGPTFPATGLCLEWIRFGPPGSGRAAQASDASQDAPPENTPV